MDIPKTFTKTFATTLDSLAKHNKVKDLHIIPAPIATDLYHAREEIRFTVQGKNGAKEITMLFPSLKKPIQLNSQLRCVLEKKGDRFVRETEFYSREIDKVGPPSMIDSIVDRCTTKFHADGSRTIRMTEIDKKEPQVVRVAVENLDSDHNRVGTVKKEYIVNGKVVPYDKDTLPKYGPIWGFLV